MNRRAVYYNPPQLAVKYCSRPEKTLVWGRGTGKTTVNADIAENNMYELPRSRGFIVGATYIQIMTLELPPMIAHWERLGYQKDTHYFIGQRPPRAWRKHWPEAHHMPQKVENLIWWHNGSVIQLISFDRKDTGSRGGSFDWGLGIEAALLPKARLDRELLPAMRPTHYSFKKSRYSGGMCYTSTMPYTQSGAWLFEAEKQQEAETINILGSQGAHADYLALKKIDNPTDKETEQLAKFEKQLKLGQKIRKVLYLEATARENLYTLGEDYFAQQRRRLSPLIFDVEIMNKRVNQLPNSFYFKYSDAAHLYGQAVDYHHLDSIGLELDRFRNDCRNDADVVRGVPVQMSLDFNGDIFTLTAFQYLRSINEVRFLKNFYAKEGEGLDELIGRFCDYYDPHDLHFTEIWGDRNGHFERDNSRTTYYNDVMSKLKKRGWKFELKAPVHNIEHGERFLMINRMLAEAEPRLPRIRINEHNCKELVISIKSSPTKRTDGKIQKDKSSERDENVLAEHATHFSDTFDYALFQFFSWSEISAGGFSFGFGSI